MQIVDSICVRVTSLCNLKCLHCRAPQNSKRKHLDQRAFMRFAIDLKTFGLSHISLSGGEPLYCPFIIDMIKSCREIGIGVALTTNGTLHKQLNDLLSCFSDANDILIKISVDGNKCQHDAIRGNGAYSKAISSICLVSQSTLKLELIR